MAVKQRYQKRADYTSNFMTLTNLPTTPDNAKKFHKFRSAKPIIPNCFNLTLNAPKNIIIF
jgi:predicted ABC-type ATPase